VSALAALLAVVGAVPALFPAVASAAGIKVVVIVGPVEGLTPTYRGWAEKVALTAEKYGADVRRIYSPNATWTNVLNNIQGASIVVYMGHGNGFPSPYSSTLNPDKVDGFGLNTSTSPSDYTHAYYGESYIARYVKLAANAVVFLSHACYAAGSSESWDVDPTVDVAKQRVDNFAAGFVSAGARAVFALAHADPSPYVAKLFTSTSTMKTIFETASDWNGTWVKRFASIRSPGFDAELDPSLDTRLDPPQPSYYLRSLVTYPGLTAAQVRSLDPLAPTLSGFAPQPAYVSPNGDSVKDTVTFAGTWSASTAWRLSVQKSDGALLTTTTGSGTGLSASWAGDDGSATVPDGVYRVVVDATDGGGHVSGPYFFPVTVDMVDPVVKGPASRLISTTMGGSTVPVKTTWSATDGGGGVAYKLQRQVNGGSWSGVSLASTTSAKVKQSLAIGDTYRYRVRATDGAGNTSAYRYGPAFRSLRTQETSSAVTYGGAWTSVSNSSASGGSYRYATAAGAWASYTFTGSSIAWVAITSTSGGSADVFIDGVLKTTIELSASTTGWRRVVYAYDWSSQGSHTIKVVANGDGRVYLDAFARLYRV